MSIIIIIILIIFWFSILWIQNPIQNDVSECNGLSYEHPLFYNCSLQIYECPTNRLLKDSKHDYHSLIKIDLLDNSLITFQKLYYSSWDGCNCKLYKYNICNTKVTVDFCFHPFVQYNRTIYEPLFQNLSIWFYKYRVNQYKDTSKIFIKELYSEELLDLEHYLSHHEFC